MASHGIIHESSCSHTPQQNGVAELKNRHLVDTARTLLLHMHVPTSFWAEAILTACYLINRMSSSILHSRTLFSLLYPHTLIYSLPLRIFGCVCFVHGLTPGTDKFTSRSHKCIFLGYAYHQRGYRCYSPTLRRYFTYVDVTFFETVLFYPSLSAPATDLFPDPSLSTPVPVLPTSTPRLDFLSDPPSPTILPLVPVSSPASASPPVPTPQVSSDPPSSPVSDLDVPIAFRKGRRSCYTEHHLHRFVNYSYLSPSYHAFVSSLSSVSIPTSVAEALAHPGWRTAMV